MGSLRNILWLGLKEFKSLVSDTVMMLFVVYAFTLAIYTQATGTSSEVNNASIAFADEDQSALSKEMFNAFYPPRFKLPELISTADIEDAMDKGLYMFVVTVPPRFENDLRAGRNPDIQLSIDATAMQQAGIGSNYIKNIVNDRVASFLQRTDQQPPPPINLVVRKLFNPNGVSAWFTGVVAIINQLTLLTVVLTGAAVIREREHGTLEHLLVMPLTAFEIAMAKVWSNGLVILLATTASLFIVVQKALQVPFAGSVTLLLEISRNIRRKGERLRWGAISAATQFSDISNSGTLTGISGINQGLGLDIQLFGSLRYRFDWQEPKRETFSFRASGNAFYKVTPLLTGTLTVNPDFSDAPLDVLQVNTTRFNLFQPETRDFFLQDVSTFEFGGRGFAAGFNYYYSTDNAQPFFSRNIGLANGLPVSIVSGGKLSGEYAGFGIGALSVVTNGTGDTKRNQVLSVVRVTRPLGESKAGILVTNGDPSGRSRNTVAGADFQYRDSNFLPGKIFQSDFYYQRSFSNKVGDDDSFGIAPTFPNEPWGGEAHFKQVGRNFAPALGFVNRTGIRQYDGRAQYRRRDLGWRWLDLGTSWYVVTGLNNHIESRENAFLAGVSLRTTDEAYMRIVDDFEDVPAPFKIAGRVPVPVGRYHWTNINPTFRTSEGRPFYVRGDIQCCSYYNGDYFRIDLQTDFRPHSLFQISPHYTYTYVNLPTGLVNIHQLATDFRVNFTPDMQLLAQLQYDNISEKFALSFRYRWEYEPGQELFASLGQSAVIPGEPTFTPNSTQASIRLGHTFRF